MKLRHEKKYLVLNKDLTRLRAAFLPFLVPDNHTSITENGYPEYTVRSIYFDSPDKKSVHEKIAGVEERKKLRIRGYDHPDEQTEIFLEVKRKLGNRIAKNRSLIPYKSIEEVIDNGINEETMILLNHRNQMDDASRFLYHLKRNNMSPLNLIVYEREAYHGKFDSGLRITFDKNIRSALYPSLKNLFIEEGLEYIWKNHFILEVKYYDSNMPNFVRTIIEEFKLQTQALSKYTEGYFCHKLFAKTAI